MIEIRRSTDRGSTRLDWLESRHSFSFGHYDDPAHMGFRALRVVNEDFIAPGRGFGLHPHRDMEILTFVLSGVLTHRDDLGSRGVIGPGAVQRMTAGTGVFHSEINASPDEVLRLLQVWIRPEARSLEPSWEERRFASEFRLVASRDGREGSLRVNADVSVYRGRVTEGETAKLSLAPDRAAWAFVSDGRVEVAGATLSAGDAVAITDEPEITLRATRDSELLLFDLAPC